MIKCAVITCAFTWEHRLLVSFNAKITKVIFSATFPLQRNQFLSLYSITFARLAGRMSWQIDRIDSLLHCKFTSSVNAHSNRVFHSDSQSCLSFSCTHFLRVALLRTVCRTGHRTAQPGTFPSMWPYAWELCVCVRAVWVRCSQRHHLILGVFRFVSRAEPPRSHRCELEASWALGTLRAGYHEFMSAFLATRRPRSLGSGCSQESELRLQPRLAGPPPPWGLEPPLPGSHIGKTVTPQLPPEGARPETTTERDVSGTPER